MLHLLPTRVLLTCFAVFVSLSVLAALRVGWIGGRPSADLLWIVRWSSSLSLMAIALPFAIWRWSGAVQARIFPYLGGRWTGQIRFEGANGTGARNVELAIKHNLFGARMLLESAESTSTTLLVHAERDPDFDHHKLYYVYLNERREGVLGAGQRYRGLAVIRIVPGAPARLEGSYFTETYRSGTLHLARKSTPAWWQFWH